MALSIGILPAIEWAYHAVSNPPWFFVMPKIYESKLGKKLVYILPCEAIYINNLPEQ
jgi:hypothetical protein